MKRIIILAIICLLLLTGCESNKKRLITIEYDELKEKINNKDTFILIVTRTDCSHCALYLPKLEKVLKDYDLVAYKIEVDTWKEEQKNDLTDICNVSGTPTTIFMSEGEEINTSSRLVGDRSIDQIVQRFKAMGYIKSDNKSDEDKSEE